MHKEYTSPTTRQRKSAAGQTTTPRVGSMACQRTTETKGQAARIGTGSTTLGVMAWQGPPYNYNRRRPSNPGSGRHPRRRIKGEAPPCMPHSRGTENQAMRKHQERIQRAAGGVQLERQRNGFRSLNTCYPESHRPLHRLASSRY